MNKLQVLLLTSLMLLCSTTGMAQPKGHKIGVPEMKTIHVVPIGIVSYRDYNKKYSANFKDLNSASDLCEYESSIDSILGKSYKNVCPHVLSHRDGRVSAVEVEGLFNRLMNDVQESDVVLIHILAHGKLIDGKFHLICSDDAVSGENIRDKLMKMANKKNVLIVLFLNTCNSGALFNEPVNLDKGAIAFYASSGPNMISLQTKQQETEFTNRIIKELKMEGSTEAPNYITLETIENVLTNKPLITPEPVIRYFPDKGNFNGYRINLYPLLRAVDKTEKPKKNRFYGGIAGGLNHTPTPYGSVSFGVDINRWKVEVGGSIAITTSDEVLIYNSNGMMKSAYDYRGYNVYGRLGYNVAKKDSRWEVVPLAGISGNFIIGSHIKGFNNSIGETAGSLMLPLNFRVAYDLCKNNKHNFLLHGTVGCDIPLYKDDIVKVLKENEYVKNWCSFRPYLEVGFMIKLFNF